MPFGSPANLSLDPMTMGSPYPRSSEQHDCLIGGASGTGATTQAVASCRSQCRQIQPGATMNEAYEVGLAGDVISLL